MTRELSNNINHELKTPVGVIRGYLDTIATHQEMVPEMKQKFIENARNAMDRLCNLLNDLSSITHLEEGANSISNEDVDLNDLLFNISTELESINMTNNIHFSYDIPDGCIVIGNYNLLYGMMMNLIRNADFHSRGENCGIRLLSQNSREYTFAFADDGVGVGEQHLSHLFDRFYRIDKRALTKGRRHRPRPPYRKKHGNCIRRHNLRPQPPASWPGIRIHPYESPAGGFIGGLNSGLNPGKYNKQTSHCNFINIDTSA